MSNHGEKGATKSMREMDVMSIAWHSSSAPALQYLTFFLDREDAAGKVIVCGECRRAELGEKLVGILRLKSTV